MHERRDSTLAVAAEKAKLGKRGRVVNETHPERKDTNGRCAHMTAAGLVQNAIATLPKPLQHLGHFLYSAIANGHDMNVAHALVWFTAELPACSAKKREVAYCMALAAIQSHKAAVHGRDPWGPGRVAEFVLDWYGARVDVTNWARDWNAIWEVLAHTVDKLDAKALRPVAEVVRRQHTLRSREGWRWVEVDRALVAATRSVRYAALREGIQDRLQGRLQAMGEQHLAAWFKRMQGYARAYREEWGDDIVARPELHLRYHDRVSEYWRQRERLKEAGKQVA
ncbi:hypothetical protein FQZ97_908590 [compost metagenome]